jgi:hypothetical protein
MTGLRELQAAFQGFVQCDAPGIEAAVVGDARAGSAERLDVYYQAYRLRLEEILRNDFPGLRALVDESGFRELCWRYTEMYPSVEPSVRWFGRSLEEFLQRTPPYGERAELADMARFEWAWGLVFDAPDTSTVSLETIEALPAESWQTLRFQMHPAVRRLVLSSNVPDVFQAAVRDEPVPEVICTDEPMQWLLWRRERAVYWRSIGESEAWAIDACAAGADFPALCSGLCRWYDEAAVPAQMAAQLKRWVGDRLLVEMP